ncbi:MAG TPA: Atu4866 domain-containing protein [Actinoplanes sp.]|nr:Atu4866 domain-containing protein [Actinoplanes sp.]
MPDQRNPRHRGPRPIRGPRLDATVLGAIAIIGLVLSSSATVGPPDQAGASTPPAVVNGGTAAADLVGRWSSEDDSVWLDLGADGRYAHRAARDAAVTRGAYRIEDQTLHLRADSGRRFTVTIYDGSLAVEGRQLHRL